jgi:hypothetical protein
MSNEKINSYSDSEYVHGAEKFTIDDSVREKMRKNPVGELYTWGITPLDSFNGDLKKQQRDVYDWRMGLIKNAPEYINESLYNYIECVFLNRATTMNMANYNSFYTRDLVDDKDLPSDDKELFSLATIGKASPAELMYLRNLYGLSSVELGCVTHPYGQRMEHLDQMRDSVNEAISMFNGKKLDIVNYKIKNTDVILHPREEGVSDAFFMTRKRDLAQLADNTIIRECSSFIVRIDQDSDFDQDLANNIRSVKLNNIQNVTKRLTRAGNLNVVVPQLLEENNYKTIVPLTTVTYAFNDETKSQIDISERQSEFMISQEEKTIRSLGEVSMREK